ncbi:hemolysin family protein, partial [Lachnoclostridium sp.]
TKFLSTIQVAITLAGFFSSASAATGISKVLGGYMESLSIPYSQTIAMVLVTILLSYFTLVFGELVPKRIALLKAESFSLFVVNPINTISKFMSPFIRLLSLSTNGVLRLLGFHKQTVEDVVTEEEILAMLTSGSEQGVFHELETEMINGVFSFTNKTAREIMVPRKDVFGIDINHPMEEQLDGIFESRYSRIPVYDGNKDNIIGILNIKECLPYWKHHSFLPEDVRRLMRKPHYVNDTKSVVSLFQELQKDKNRMAILIDEYGGFLGIVTMEDIVEEIVGDIDDKHSEVDFVELNENEFLVNGAMTIDDVNYELSIDLKKGKSETLSGFFIEQLGYIPEELDRTQIRVNNINLRIHDVEGKRISKVFVQIDHN